MESGLVRCPKCQRDLPESEFGTCRARKSGRNLYDRECIRKTVHAGRVQARQMKANRKAAQGQIADRKDNVISPTIGTAIKRVKEAIWLGFHTREGIQEAIGLPMDHVCDALAILNCDHGVVRFQRVQGEACFYPVRAA
jgi:hypothetical protein